MCNPAIVLAGLQFSAGIMQAKEASDAQDAAYEENLRASNQAKMDADRQINLQQAQAEEAAAVEKEVTNLETREVLARSVVAGLESGAGGISTQEVQQGIVRRGLEANSMVTQNLSRELDQLSEDRLGAKSRTQSRINSVSKGSGITLGTVLGAAAGAGSTYYGVKGATKSLSINKAGGTDS